MRNRFFAIGFNRSRRHECPGSALDLSFESGPVEPSASSRNQLGSSTEGLAAATQEKTDSASHGVSSDFSVAVSMQDLSSIIFIFRRQTIDFGVQSGSPRVPFSNPIDVFTRRWGIRGHSRRTVRR